MRKCPKSLVVKFNPNFPMHQELYEYICFKAKTSNVPIGTVLLDAAWDDYDNFLDPLTDEELQDWHKDKSKNPRRELVN